jgi:hypothetical protein
MKGLLLTFGVVLLLAPWFDDPTVNPKHLIYVMFGAYAARAIHGVMECLPKFIQFSSVLVWSGPGQAARITSAIGPCLVAQPLSYITTINCTLEEDMTSALQAFTKSFESMQIGQCMPTSNEVFADIVVWICLIFVPWDVIVRILIRVAHFVWNLGSICKQTVIYGWGIWRADILMGFIHLGEYLLKLCWGLIHLGEYLLKLCWGLIAAAAAKYWGQAWNAVQELYQIAAAKIIAMWNAASHDTAAVANPQNGQHSEVKAVGWWKEIRVVVPPPSERVLWNWDMRLVDPRHEFISSSMNTRQEQPHLVGESTTHMASENNVHAHPTCRKM